MQWRTRTPFLRASVDMNAARGVQQWVIVDDVTTTGATLREVAEVLRAVTPRARIAAAVVAVA
jgi:predicted amidophosphoribosyltransferase